MEDAHTCFLNLPGDKSASYFGVFDGHGGTKVAQYAGNNLHKKILQQPEYVSGGNICEAIRKAFLALDQDMLEDQEVRDELAGSTGVIVLLRNNKLYCGNVGDSRAIISVAGVVKPLSFDHKPSSEKERQRIVSAGGWVDWNRVNGISLMLEADGPIIHCGDSDDWEMELCQNDSVEVSVDNVDDDKETRQQTIHEVLEICLKQH